jgi:hypothetical protein
VEWWLCSGTVPVASGTFRVSLCQSPATPSEYHCASRQRHLQSITVPVASGNFRVSLCQSPAALLEPHFGSRQWHFQSMTVPVARDNFRVSLCQSPVALPEYDCASRQHTKDIRLNAFTALLIFSLPVFDAVWSGKLLPTFLTNLLPPSSGWFTNKLLVSLAYGSRKLPRHIEPNTLLNIFGTDSALTATYGLC